MQEDRFRKALQCLGDPPADHDCSGHPRRPRRDPRSGQNFRRTDALGLSNQLLAVNGTFHATDQRDAVASRSSGSKTRLWPGCRHRSPNCRETKFPLLGFDLVGLPALQGTFVALAVAPATSSRRADRRSHSICPALDRLVDEIAQGKRGLIMVMGKGGVGKTTIAAAIAVGLAKRGHAVHLTTTDPAAHVAFVVDGAMPGLTVDRIDPAVETERYVEKIMASRGRELDEQGKALLREDLASPCTEEVAVFHAFSRVVAEARSAFVVLDTAPTGHTLLLLDATGAYHRQMTRHLDPARLVGSRRR